MENTAQQQNNITEQAAKFSLREIVFKYLAHLPLFLLSIAICLGAAIVYIRYAVPKYRANANMLVKGSDDNSVSSGNNDFINSALYGGKRANIDNEFEKLRSNTFLSRVVAKNHFNIVYYNEGSIKRSNAYSGFPFEVSDWTIKDSSRTYSIYIKTNGLSGGWVSDRNKFDDGHTTAFKWGSLINFGGVQLKLNPKDPAQLVNNKIPYSVIWKPIAAATAQIRGALTVTSVSSKTTILQFSVITENPYESKDILNAIIREYSIMNVEEKNKVSQNTIAFITDRLAAVTEDLRNITQELQDYKQKNGILDLNKEFGFYFDNSYVNIKAIDAIDVNLKVLGLINDYIANASNTHKTVPVPTTLGIPDITLNGLVAKYNELQLKHERDSSQVLANSMLMVDLNSQLADLRNKIQENIKQIRGNFELQKAELKKNSVEYQSKLTSIPEKDIRIQEISRQQAIKQNLYLYLLQKREETEIGSSSTVTDYQQLDLAEASPVPVEPKEGNIRMIALLAGLLIPIVIIYILDLLNDKLTTREDISRITALPIVGEISHVDKTLSTIVVNQSRNMIAEQFRIMRSNLNFLVTADTKPQIFLVTSSISGEGKSFISLNLAAVLSLAGKRVALLEFDLRKMRSHIYDGEKQNTRGITNYLIGQTDNPEEIVTTMEKFPSLDIYRSGPIPPNPAEMVMSEKVTDFFNWLKEHYDYIVIDSAPIGLVSDSFALEKYAHQVLYVLRQRYTFKRQVQFIADIQQQQKLKNVALIVNDVHMGGKYGYYGYGYGYGYGYIYRYGFGYRYGYGYGAYAGKYFKKGTDGYFDLPNKGDKKKR